MIDGCILISFRLVYTSYEDYSERIMTAYCFIMDLSIAT